MGSATGIKTTTHYGLQDKLHWANLGFGWFATGIICGWIISAPWLSRIIMNRRWRQSVFHIIQAGTKRLHFINKRGYRALTGVNLIRVGNGVSMKSFTGIWAASIAASNPISLLL